MLWRRLLRWFGPGGATQAYLSLGSNVGDRLAHVRDAVIELDRRGGAEVVDISGVYETAPVSDVAQDPYLNMVVAVRTSLGPRRLLAACQDIEGAHGRDRSQEVRHGPRTLDIDLLLYGDARIEEENLQVPHPRLTERAFVVVPLMEVMPGGTLPDGTRLSEVAARLAPMEGVELHVRLEGLPGAGGLARPEGPPTPGAFLREEWRERESRRPPGPPPGVNR